MKTEKRKLEVENAFGESWWCAGCGLCLIPPELWVAVAVFFMATDVAADAADAEC